MWYVAILIVLLGLTAGYYSRTRKKSGSTNPGASASNVISLDQHRKSNPVKESSGNQPCSLCRKKNGKLIFYAQDNGTVVGLCKDCKSKAKKRDMLPL